MASYAMHVHGLQVREGERSLVALRPKIDDPTSMLLKRFRAKVAATVTVTLEVSVAEAVAVALSAEMP